MFYTGANVGAEQAVCVFSWQSPTAWKEPKDKHRQSCLSWSFLHCLVPPSAVQATSWTPDWDWNSCFPGVPALLSPPNDKAENDF